MANVGETDNCHSKDQRQKTNDKRPIATDSQITLLKIASGCWPLASGICHRFTDYTYKKFPIKIICEISSNLKNLRDGLKAVNVF